MFPAVRKLKTTILIADDHALFRDSLRSLLSARGIDVVGEAKGEAAGWPSGKAVPRSTDLVKFSLS